MFTYCFGCFHATVAKLGSYERLYGPHNLKDYCLAEKITASFREKACRPIFNMTEGHYYEYLGIISP